MNEIGLSIELVARILIATFCGILVGYERRNKYKVAGVKTHMTVGFAAALMMVTSKYGFHDSAYFDASRIASQIVSGVGFLGAGIIFKRNQSVYGLTTAAGVWTTAGVGMAVGAGQYLIGIASTIGFVGIHYIVQTMRIFNNNGIQEMYTISADENKRTTHQILELCKDLRIVNYTIERENKSIILNVSIVFEDEEQKKEWIEKILSKKYITSLDYY